MSPLKPSPYNLPEVSATDQCPRAIIDGDVEAYMEVIDALDGFCHLIKRSATLEGTMPLRAVQGCRPLSEGNEAGHHVRFSRRAILTQTDAGPALGLGDADALTANLPSRVQQLVDRGHLAADGYWHTRLSGGLAWRSGPGRIAFWTGLLVRPQRGVWLLQGQARNRRSFVDVSEVVIHDHEEFVPVVIELDATSVRTNPTLLEHETCSILPLRPSTTFSETSIESEPAIGEAYAEFYTDEYFDRRASMESVGAYRRLTRTSKAAAPGIAACQLIYLGGPTVHEVCTFDRFVDGSGPRDPGALKANYKFLELRNITDIRGACDGTSVLYIKADVAEGAAALCNRWKTLYGDETRRAIEAIAPYVGRARSPHREPHFTIMPWILATTPEGWSTVLDSACTPEFDGYRAVVATDRFFSLAPVYHCTKPGEFGIDAGAGVSRALPIPQSLINAPVRWLT